MKMRAVVSAALFLIFLLSSQTLTLGRYTGFDKTGDAERYYMAGVTHFESGEYEKAVDALKKAIQLKSDSSDSYYRLGMSYGSLGQYKEAAEAYNLAVGIKEDYAAAYHNLGHAYSNLNKHDDAIKAFRQALRHEPGNLESYVGLGNAYYDSGDYKKAVSVFEEAIRLNPDNPYTYFSLGLLYFPDGPYAEAVDAFTQAIQRDSRYAEAYHNRAYAYLLMGRGDSAATDAETYLNLKGWRAERSLRMAIVAFFGHLEARREASARKVLDQAVSRSDHAAWPFPAIEYLRRDISARIFYKAATDKDKKAEARAYIGLDLSIRDKAEAAMEHLRWAKEHSRPGRLDKALAISELDRIKARSAVAVKN